MPNTIKSEILKGAQYKKTANNEIQKVHLETDSDQVLVGNSTLTQKLSDIQTAISNVPDTNTTYTFANGTDGFTVTPSGGSAQTVKVSTNLAGDNLSGTLPVGKGGTGATSAADARTNLGLGAAAVKSVTTSVTSGSDALVTSGAVFTAIDNLPEPMVFKGSLGTSGTITSLPTAASSNEGHTYKVITAGTYASKAAKVGDTFICAKTGSSSYEWVLIPSGDEPSGTVTSVGLTMPTGFSVSSSPVTSSGTLAVSFASGYSLPTTAKQTAWDGKATGSITTTAGSEVVTINSNSLNVVTRDTSQTISGLKDFTNDGGIYINGLYKIKTINPQTSGGLMISNLAQSYAVQLYGATWSPVTNGGADLGKSDLRWKDLYLSGNLSDGTNSVTIASLVSKYTKPSGGIPSSDLATSGVTAGTYSAVQVNNKGIVTSGAYNIKYASSTDADVSDLVVGGTLYVVS